MGIGTDYKEIFLMWRDMS